jgi:nucleoside-triphosphatase THEP1
MSEIKIIVEGPVGSGKSYLCGMIRDCLENELQDIISQAIEVNALTYDSDVKMLGKESVKNLAKDYWHANKPDITIIEKNT